MLGAACGALGCAGCTRGSVGGVAAAGIATPPLWRLSREPGGRHGWLLGSVHAGIDDDEPLSSTIANAWHDADVLAIELDVDARWHSLRDAYQRAARLPDGATIESLIGTERAGEIRRFLGADASRWQRLRGLAPWALGTMLGAAVDPTPATTGRSGIERRFIADARARRRPIVELEQPAEQVDAIAGGPLEQQAVQLLRRFDRARRDDDTVAATIAAWRSGDDDRLAAIKDRLWGRNDDAAPMRERMFGVRDRRMARRLATLLEQRHTVFTVVGALHLVGDDSLPGMLGALGIRVERMRHDRGAGIR